MQRTSSLLVGDQGTYPDVVDIVTAAGVFVQVVRWWRPPNHHQRCHSNGWDAAISSCILHVAYSVETSAQYYLFVFIIIIISSNYRPSLIFDSQTHLLLTSRQRVQN